MPAVVVEIADAVTYLLNDASLSHSFTATREYVPVIELSTMGDAVFVTVVPRELSIVALSESPSDTSKPFVASSLNQLKMYMDSCLTPA
jgi:hypothetical protein